MCGDVLLWNFFDTKTGYKFYSNSAPEDAERIIRDLKADGKEAVKGPKAPWIHYGKPIPNKSKTDVGVYIKNW